VLILPQCVALDSARFAAALQEHGVTILFQTTALFNRRAHASPEIFSGLRYVLFGGEAADVNAMKEVARTAVPQNLLNIYGPTEATAFATWYPASALEEDARNVPIGRPIANTQVYILDRRMRPVPIGVGGEIYIGGPGVALGYLNRPELTAARFVPDPFGSDPQGRLYRTGDLGRWRANGTIEYLGRNDQQVKIRGFRIELGEIEAHLSRHPRVKAAAVLAREDAPGEKRLVAYLVLDASSDAAVSAEELRSHLRGVVSEYMVPSAFVMLDRLPLTANGKLDRRALPAPEIEAFAHREYEEPRGALEQALADIWRALLHVERVGRHDDFFALGGHSLHGLSLTAQVFARFGVHLPVVAVFQHPTIMRMAQAVQLLQPPSEGRTDDAAEIEEGVV
jgi:acyl-coenzyme A synthetase/AMP-(fatty) acid ligase